MELQRRWHQGLGMAVAMFGVFVAAQCCAAADVARRITYESDLSIRQMIGNAVLKLVNLDELLQENPAKIEDVIKARLDQLHDEVGRLAAGRTITIDLESIELRIDDQVQERGDENVRKVIRRLKEYVVSPDGTRPGSVEMRFTYWIDGTRVRRMNRVTDNHIRAVAELDGALPRIDYARLQVDVEIVRDKGTNFTTVAAVHAPFGRHPNGPITRFAERVMTREVDAKLVKVDSEFRSLVESDQNAVKLLGHLIEEFMVGSGN